MKKTLQRSTAEAGRVVLGIDPGSLVTGYGLVSVEADGVRYLDCGTIVNRSSVPMAERLRVIYEGLCETIGRWRPSEAAVESAFYGKNVQSALKLGHARGVAMLAAVNAGMIPAEYAPREVKLAVVGRGNASKEQVQFMVKTLLRSRSRSMVLDASDALAVALCHAGRRGARVTQHRDWSAFVAAHPELVRR
jgi:crossover junction endodeoxyribonuclease RuvC